MKKAIIIGGNQGGLNMARCLAEAGFEVKLYEKKRREDVAFDWTDDIAPAVFERIGIPMPPKDAYYPKKPWTFVNPSETVKISVYSAQQSDISIYRRPLNDYLYSLLKDKSVVEYETEVEKLISDGTKVKGVVVEGKEEYCDLVVDCSGVYSKFRASLDSKAKIMAQPKEDEVFVAYRGFFKAKEGENVEHTNKAYLKHIGRKGISWCIYDDGIVDILIGSIGKLTDEDFNAAMNDLKKDNPVLSDELVKAGYTSVIPVRYPISKMVTDGYVLCGDSAFMTIPMMGSGIVCSLDCGKMLKDVLTENDDCTVENLWKYQVKFFSMYASFCGVDILKRWMLGMDNDDLNFMFESGVMDEKLLGNGSSGGLLKITFPQMLQMGWKGRKRISVLMKAASVASNSRKVADLAKGIPAVYDEKAVGNWQEKLDGLYE